MSIKWTILIIGLVASSVFSQAKKMLTIIASYSNYNIQIVTDNTIEVKLLPPEAVAWLY